MIRGRPSAQPQRTRKARSRRDDAFAEDERDGAAPARLGTTVMRELGASRAPVSIVNSPDGHRRRAKRRARVRETRTDAAAVPRGCSPAAASAWRVQPAGAPAARSSPGSSDATSHCAGRSGSPGGRGRRAAAADRRCRRAPRRQTRRRRRSPADRVRSAARGAQSARCRHRGDKRRHQHHGRAGNAPPHTRTRASPAAAARRGRS